MFGKEVEVKKDELDICKMIREHEFRGAEDCGVVGY